MFFGEHTSKRIIGSKDSRLSGKKIVLCVTGSVASVKAPELARGLMRLGAEVFVVMTEMAQEIIHPHLMEWATGNPVLTELTGKVEHVTYAGEHANRADLILVAPCTANTLGKVAVAIDDTPVTTTLTTAIGSRDARVESITISTDAPGFAKSFRINLKDEVSPSSARIAFKWKSTKFTSSPNSLA